MSEPVMEDLQPGEQIVSRAHAHAKINRSLAVGSRGADGYHPVATLMQRLVLSDEVEVRCVPQGGDGPGVVDVTCPQLDAEGGDTLVTRAVRAWLDTSGAPVDVHVRIDKQIPLGAGLGGGSSDAGTVLAVLQELSGAPLPADELTCIALGIGSDVPFFALPVGPAAVVSGKGEVVEQVPRNQLPIAEPVILVWPGVVQSTAAVYGRYRSARAQLPAAGELVAAHGEPFNDLTEAALAESDECRAVFEAARTAGLDPFVCGSGSTVAVLCPEDPDAAEQAWRAALPDLPRLRLIRTMTV